MKTNETGTKLIIEFEGLRLSSYLCPKGVWTIGFGATGPDIVKGLVWTEDQAWARLREDIEARERQVENAVTVPLNENQFSALVSFVFNLGIGRLRSSTLLRRLNAGDYLSAAAEFERWDNVCDHTGCREEKGLRLRRRAEQDLFLTAA